MVNITFVEHEADENVPPAVGVKKYLTHPREILMPNLKITRMMYSIQDVALGIHIGPRPLRMLSNRTLRITAFLQTILRST